mgnify:CR=1 FL=1
MVLLNVPNASLELLFIKENADSVLQAARNVMEPTSLNATTATRDFISQVDPVSNVETTARLVYPAQTALNVPVVFTSMKVFATRTANSLVKIVSTENPPNV